MCEESYPQLFEYVFVIGLKEDLHKKLSTQITYRFPPVPDGTVEDSAIQSVNQFCFPDIDSWKPVKKYKSESYSFVLTNIVGKRRFGYCRRLLPEGKGARFPEVFCIISPFGCFDLYKKVLDRVEQRRAVSNVAVFTLLKSLIANPFPAPGETVSIKMLPAKFGDLEQIDLTRLHDSRLEHVDFGELYNTLGPKRIIQVFSSLLMERRVILSAQRLSTLSSCCHALLALLYPFEWHHTFIPVLPSSLIDFCCSPMPFIIGINPDMAKQLDHLDLQVEDVLVVDLSKKKLLKKVGDESSILPNHLFEYLLHLLEAPAVSAEYKAAAHSSSKDTSRADRVVVDAFMTMFAYLCGNYRDFFTTTNAKTSGRVHVFQRNDFIQSFHSEETRRFLESFQMTQMFEVFIECRENPMKAEAVTKGLFEKVLPKLRERIRDIDLPSARAEGKN